MAISKVIVPTTANGDYDFLAFSFNGLHSWDDFKIIRVSDGDRYNTELGPQSQDKTAENPGGDGMYYFNTNHKQKVFNINFAFEEIDDVTIRNMKKWLSSKELGDLWFEEEPYKVYSAKVTGQPTLKYIPFDKLENGTKKRIYRGEGSVQFTAYWPYAHTPDKICARTTDANDLTEAGSEIGNGKDFDKYSNFRNKDEWKIVSGLYTTNSGECKGENLGDLLAPFKLIIPDSATIKKSMYVRVGDLTIQLEESVKGLQWDSKTGIVSGIISASARRPISVTGNTIGGIPTSTITTSSDTSTASRCDVKIYKSASANNTNDYRINNGVWERYNAGAATENKWETSGSMPSLQYHYWYY